MTAEPYGPERYTLSEAHLRALLTQAFTAGYATHRGAGAVGRREECIAHGLSLACNWSDLLQGFPQDEPRCAVCGELHGVLTPTLEHREMARYC